MCCVEKEDAVTETSVMVSNSDNKDNNKNNNNTVTNIPKIKTTNLTMTKNLPCR